MTGDTIRKAPSAVTAGLLAAALVALPRAAAPAPAPAPRPNLLANGSFEDGPDAGAHRPLHPGGQEVKGWTATRGPIDYVGGHWRAAHGQRSLDLHGSPGRGGIKQSIRTKPGHV